MGILVKNETLPIGDYIVFTMCDHSSQGIGQQLLNAVFSGDPMKAISQVSCNPTGVPMYTAMVQLLIDNITKAMTMVDDQSSVELLLTSPDDGVDKPKIRILLGHVVGLVIEVRVDSAIYMDGTMDEVPGGDDRDYIRGTLDWDELPEFVASMREELTLYRMNHPDAPDDAVGAEV